MLYFQFHITHILNMNMHTTIFHTIFLICEKHNIFSFIYTHVHITPTSIPKVDFQLYLLLYSLLQSCFGPLHFPLLIPRNNIYIIIYIYYAIYNQSTTISILYDVYQLVYIKFKLCICIFIHLAKFKICNIYIFAIWWHLWAKLKPKIVAI